MIVVLEVVVEYTVEVMLVVVVAVLTPRNVEQKELPQRFENWSHASGSTKTLLLLVMNRNLVLGARASRAWAEAVATATRIVKKSNKHGNIERLNKDDLELGT